MSDMSSLHKNGSSPLVHPPKLGGSYLPSCTVFGGAHGMPSSGVFSNPFVPRPPLKTDVVSTGTLDTSRTDCIIAPGRLNPFGAKSCDSECDSGGFPNKDSNPSAPKFQLRPSVLRPPDSSGSKGSILKPAKLPDPRKTSNKDVDKNMLKQDANKSNLGAASSDAGEVNSSEDRVEGSDLNSSDSGAENFAAELSKNNKLKDSVASSVISSSQSGFVFGQNLSQRVTGVTEGAEGPSGAAEASSTTSSLLVFGENLSNRVILSNGTSASQADGQEENVDNEAQAAAARTGQTLEESAREYQAKRDNKVDLKEVQVITGEENESNVLQANAKLFVFDSETQSWVERGRGIVRLNDMSPHNSHTFQSRLVMRTQGSLRVILNAKIWSGMNVERASTKAIRITATDSDQTVKIFLIVTNPKDSENLLRAIDWRIQQRKIHEEHSKQASPTQHAEKRKADPDAESPVMCKARKVHHEGVTGMLRKEESDSSVQDPETEASCESHSSSLTVKSESD
ncbi:ran-binding protein 3-like isoform X2 [Pomacea canaliculata]|nr:ran-binding protein 3-like isoform X2 [Pomacea canaliculata]XP_025109646.1 ran-binding protein 3-like isoform X2 [Pomacea canaliculata]XP_025109647.1 ran-binding protein 3-like isoform X2 [Pomacea canaliculata]